MLPVKDGSTARQRPFCDHDSVKHLRHAAESGSLDELWRLQDAGIKINARDARGNTAFQQMVVLGNLPAATLLKKVGAKINLRDGAGCPPLVKAIDDQQPAIVTALLAWHADPGLATSEGMTPLRCAVVKGEPGMVKELLLAGADPNKADGEGKAALHLARSDLVAAVLLDNGADIELENNPGMTPLHVAIESGNVPLVRLLKERGARPSSNTAALLRSVARSGSVEMLELVLGWSADYQRRAIGLAQILVDIAVNFGHADLLRALKKNGIYVGPQIRQLTKAIQSGHAATVRVLLEWDKPGKPLANSGLILTFSVLSTFVNPVAPPVFKGKLELALCEAVRRGHADVVDALLDEDLDFDADAFSTSPLHLAVQGGHTETASRLLRKFPLAKRSDVASILIVAVMNGTPQLVTLLVRAIPPDDRRKQCAPAALAAAARDAYPVFPTLIADLKADSDEAVALMQMAAQRNSLAVLSQLLAKDCKPRAELLTMATRSIVIDLLQHVLSEKKPANFQYQQNSRLLLLAMEELLIQPRLSREALLALFLQMGLRGTNHARFDKTYFDMWSAFDENGQEQTTLLQRRLVFAMLFIEQKDDAPYTDESEKYKLSDRQFNALSKAARAQVGEAKLSCRAFMKAWHDKQLTRMASTCLSHTSMDLSSLSRLGDALIDETGLFNDIAAQVADCWRVALRAASRAAPVQCRLLELPAWMEANVPPYFGAEISRRAAAALDRDSEARSPVAAVRAIQARFVLDYGLAIRGPDEASSSSTTGNG